MTAPSVDVAAEHLSAVWESVPAEERARALAGGWYRESRRTARALARRHGTTLATAAGVLAALSPRVKWSDNVRGAETVLSGREGPLPGYGANVAKAYRIAAGERPLDVLGGDKVRAFYRAIMGDDTAAVVDVWVLRAAGHGDAAATGRQYAAVRRIVEEALHQAARAYGLPTATFQAIVWTHVRGSAD